VGRRRCKVRLVAGSGGGDPKEYKAVKVDIHQTLVQSKHSPELGPPAPGAIEALKAWQQAGVQIWLSCGGFRGDSADYKKKLRLWLQRYGIDPDKGVGFLPDQKYMADISDRAVPFTDWASARKEADRRLASLAKEGNPDAISA
jgi:hypothetical protein